MRARRVFGAVDSHTEGMPTRVITSGVGVLPGATMFERMTHLAGSRDDLRTLLMCEPRGHGAMSGAILQPPTRPDADVGVDRVGALREVEPVDIYQAVARKVRGCCCVRLQRG